MYTLKLHGVSKSINNIQILKNINFLAKKGEIISILGSSGIGKSTFLRCLCGLDKIDKGSISIYGKDFVNNGIYKSKNEEIKILSNIGFIFQDFNLFNNLTVIQNIEIPAKNKKIFSDKDLKQKSKDLVYKFKLQGKENCYPKNLSGGQKQRVAIARALILQPSIILFDEPTASLDLDLINDVSLIIKELSKSGKTIVVVTHNIDFCNNISDKIFYIKNGYMLLK